MNSASAFILIGGKSNRFGSPKWKVMVGTRSVLDRIWDACNAFENRVVVGKNFSSENSYPFIKDILKIEAPVNGLYTALESTETDWNLLLSCDLPLIDSFIFHSLRTHITEQTDAVLPIANGITQVTCGLYRKRILPVIENEIQKNHYSLFHLTNLINSKTIDFGDDPRFWNMNTEKDFNEILKYLNR